MDTLLNQIIDQLIPNLDPQLRSEVKGKISLHLMEYIKRRIFENDQNGEQSFEDDIAKIEDVKQRSEEYGKRLSEKLESLPSDQKEAILNNAMEELAEVIYKVYNVAKGDQSG